MMMMMAPNASLGTPFAPTPLEETKAILVDEKQPIVKRMQSLFVARHHGGKEAAAVLLSALDGGGRASTLFRHEAAYVLGQLGEDIAVNRLIALLKDTTEDEMVRHEAAEALGAIGAPRAEEVIRSFCDDDAAPVRETCQLAYRRLLLQAEAARKGKKLSSSLSSSSSHNSSSSETGDDDAVSCSPPSSVSAFNTVDPEEPFEGCSAADILRLQKLLSDMNEKLHVRYRALFTLRDIATKEAADAIARCLIRDNSSALLRHEVAFVLGQLQQPQTANQLHECLRNEEEHPMARHEAALALGAVGVAAVAAMEKEKMTPSSSVDEETSSTTTTTTTSAVVTKQQQQQQQQPGKTTKDIVGNGDCNGDGIGGGLVENATAQEALEASATTTLRVVTSVLHNFSFHDLQVVRESAEVALQNVVDESKENDAAMAVISSAVEVNETNDKIIKNNNNNNNENKSS